MKQITLSENEQVQILVPEGFHLGVQFLTSDSGSNVIITQRRDADFEMKHPEIPRCVECQKAIFTEKEKYLADENGKSSICEKCAYREMPLSARRW